MNVVVLTGRLATDVQFSLTMNGRSVSNFLLAVPYSYTKDENGNYPTNFFSVTAWNRVAERCRDNLIKGRPIALKGHLVQNEYTNKKYTDANGDPITIRSARVIADQVDFFGYRKQYSDGTPKEDNELPNAEVGLPPLEKMKYTDELPDEEIPF